MEEMKEVKQRNEIKVVRHKPHHVWTIFSPSILSLPPFAHFLQPHNTRKDRFQVNFQD